ncbi:MAG: DUF4340 domain-containing protein [candidate division NC10 bacterium]|nr:DUF4340 domain-containing protein [candidate division NC10 bacterium]
MSTRTTLILFVILIILAGLYYLSEHRREKPSGEAGKRVYSFTQDAVMEVSLNRGDERLTMKREGDEWTLVDPIRARGDQTAISYLVSVLTRATIERTLEESSPNLKEFGLDPPALQVRVTLKNGAFLSPLLLGTKNPSGSFLYAKLKDQPAILLLPEALERDLNKTAYDLRDKTVLAFDRDKVEKLEVSSPAGEFTLARQGKEWWLLTPIKGRADERQVDRLLWSLKDARVKEFTVADKRGLTPSGLDRPSLTVRIWEQGEKRHKVLLMAKAAKRPDAFYAKADPGEGIVMVEARLFDDLNTNPSTLQDRRLLAFETIDIKTLAFRYPDRAIVVEKTGDTWKLKTPEDGEARAGKVSALLFSLKDLEFQAIVTEKGDELKRYSLDKPKMEITLTKTNGTSLPTLLLGKTEEEKLYAKLKPFSTIYAINPKLLDELPQTAEALRQEGK